MKNILLTTFLLLNTICVFSQEYNREQEALRNEIAEFMKGEGYNPEKQNDGLKFKNNGNVYYIEIDKDSTEPMYIRLRRYVKYDEKVNMEKFSQKLIEYNKWFGAKVFCTEKSYVISVEMYLTKATDFTSVFKTLLSRINLVFNSINE